LKLMGAGSMTFLYPGKAVGRDTDVDKFTFLFQGDSITDGNRGRSADPNHILGHGYVFSVASSLGSKFPSRNLSFINRGISGNKIADLINRWDDDAIREAPDVMTILVGINDIHADVNSGNSANTETFEEKYRQLLDNTKKQLPNTLIVLGEPFILPVGMVNSKPEEWKNKITIAQEAVRKLTHEYNAAHLPFQKMFDDACRLAPADYWIWDGIHPTYSGHGLMASMWLNIVGKRCGKIAD